jgi:hemoglobin-like flavoprotein
MINESVRSSFERCEAAGDIGETFYGIFLKKSPEIADLFANTDFKKQRKHLRASVFLLVNRNVEEPKAKEVLEGIGRSHNKSNLDIRPELYGIFLESLCETVKEMDPQWSEELDSSWRQQVLPGVHIITSLY